MILQYPIHEAKLKPFIGGTVCVILKDGSMYYGIVDSVKKNQLFLRSFHEHSTSNIADDRAQISGFGIGIGALVGGVGLGLGLLHVVIAMNRFRFVF